MEGNQAEFLINFIQTLSSLHSCNSSSSLNPPFCTFNDTILIPPPTSIALAPTPLPFFFFLPLRESPHFTSFLVSFRYFLQEVCRTFRSIVLGHRVLFQSRSGVSVQCHITVRTGTESVFWWCKTNLPKQTPFVFFDSKCFTRPLLLLTSIVCRMHFGMLLLIGLECVCVYLCSLRGAD